MPKSSTKDMVGGMDTGGGVGFGIPADYGVRDSTPDPVIDQHNALAEKRLGSMILPSRKQVGPLSDSYVILPDGHPIRQRAERFEQSFMPVYRQYARADVLLSIQKSAAERLKVIANNIANDAREKQRVWEPAVATFANGHPIASHYDEAIAGWKDAVENALRTYGLRLWEVSPKFVDGFRTLASLDIEVENPFGPERPYDMAVQAFDEAVHELHIIGENGGGEILSDYQESKAAYESHLEDLERTKKDIMEASKIRQRAGKSQNLRLLETLGGNAFATSPLSNVPNYHLALETSPRVCGSCRFFEGGKETARGHCHAFDFTAKANYTCDAWQAGSLTDAHTPVRDGGFMRRKDADTAWREPLYRSPVTDIDGSPDVIPGRVSGYVIDTQDISESINEIDSNINYSRPQPADDNAALRAAENTFLPGDIVYSKALRTLAVVQNSMRVGKNNVYSLKLIDNRGGAWGSGISYGNDLQPRSKSAVKRANRLKSVKSDDLQDVIEVTRSVYRALQEIAETHADFVNMPLSNKDVLNPLQQDMLKTLEGPMFASVTTGPKRKYYRALQTATWAIGAARQVLFEGHKAINLIRRSDPSAKANMRNVMMKAQRDAYDRVKEALAQVGASLTLPSATHGDPAPGLKVLFRRGMAKKDVAEGLFKLVAENTTYHDLEPDTSKVPLNAMRFTLSRVCKNSNTDETQTAANDLVDEIRALSRKSNVDIDIEEVQTESLNELDHVASATFVACAQI